MRGDVLLVATGRTPNGDLLDAEQAGVKVTASGQVVVDEYQRTSARGIFALGDVSSDYQLKHVANHEARVVKHNLLQDWDDTDALMPSNHRYVPSAVFTDPQIASVGLTENQARAKGFNIKVKIQDFSDVAYGWAMEDTTGIAKIIVDDDTGLILGAHIMGHQASSLIQPLIQAMASICRRRTWRAASTGSTQRCPRWSRTRCWRCAASRPGRRPSGTDFTRPPVPSAPRPVRSARPPGRSTRPRRTARRS